MRHLAHCLSLLRMRLCFPLSCLGIGLVSTWSELSFIHSPLPFEELSRLLFQVFNLSSIVAMAVVALLVRVGRLDHTLVSRRGNLVLATVLLMLSTCTSYFAVGFAGTSPVMLVLSAVLGGVGLGFLFVMWFEVVSHLRPAELLLCYAVGCVIRVVLIWLGSGMEADRQWFWLLLVCAVAILLLRKARDEVAKEAPSLVPLRDESDAASHPAEERCSFPLKPLLFVITGTLTLSLAMSMGGDAAGTNGNPGVLTAAVIAAVLAVSKGDAFQFKWLWQISLGFIAAGVIVYAVYGTGMPLLSGFLVSSSYELCLMLVYCILGDLVYRSFYNSTFLYSIEICISIGAGMTSDFLFTGLSYAFPSQINIVLTLVISLFALCFAVVAVRTFSSPNLESRWSPLVKKPVGQDMAPLLERSRLGLRCHELAAEAGLSSREEEVLLLLAQKKKPAAIASQLVIEVSTVNTHKKHIYRKLDVHSAKELQARIGQAEKEAD